MSRRPKSLSEAELIDLEERLNRDSWIEIGAATAKPLKRLEKHHGQKKAAPQPPSGTPLNEGSGSG